MSRSAPELSATHYGEEMWALYEKSELLSDSALTGEFVFDEHAADVHAVMMSIEDARQEAIIRQQGREHAANVIDVPAERRAIRKGIARALSKEFRREIRGLESPYGDGQASQIICEALQKTPLGPKLLFKRPDLA